MAQPTADPNAEIPESVSPLATASLSLRGMHCGSCVSRIEKALESTPGVASASVNFATERASVEYDPGVVDPPSLVGVVTKAGYQAELLRPPSGADGSPQTHHQHSASSPQPASGLSHDHSAGDERTWRQLAAIGLLLGVPVAILGMLVPGRASGIVQLVLTALLQVIIGRMYFIGAWRSALRLPPRADMDTLVALGTAAAFGYSIYTLVRGGESHFYFDTAAVILALIAVGKWMELRARGQARRSLAGLIDLRPQSATVLRGGREESVPVADLRAGDTVIVKPGGRVPVDGTITEGRAVLDESMVTGESMPVEKLPGATVIGGTINQTGSFRFTATRVGEDSLLGQIILLVDRAQASKSGVQRLADRVAGVFVPIVLLIAAVACVAWGLLAADWSRGIQAAIAVLIVACPCALGLAVPTAVMVGTSLGARRGILIRHAGVLERIGSLDTVLLDKTGTLTSGKPEVTEIVSASAGVDSNRLVALAAAVERFSEHPIAQAIVRSAAQGGPLLIATDFRSQTGIGVSGRVDGREIAVGRPEPGDSPHLVRALRDQGKTIVAVREGRRLLGLIAVADTLRPGARAALERLGALRLHVMLLTGDNAATATAVAHQVGIDDVRAEVLPTEKEAAIRSLQSQGRRVAMVGDGVNDAPALAAADIGIAVGSGADIAKEAGDLVLVSPDPALIPQAIRLSRAMMARIRLGLGWAFLYNIVLVPLAAFGLVHPMLAAAAMGLSSVSVVLNALSLHLVRLNDPQ